MMAIEIIKAATTMATARFPLFSCSWMSIRRVMNFAADAAKKDHEFVAINPVIVETSKQIVDDREGCLSFPELYAKVRRSKKVRVQAYNLKGELYEMTCEDLPARVWQHEIDHLDGTLFIDKMGMVGRMQSKKMLKQFEEEYYEAQKKGEIPPELPPKF